MGNKILLSAVAVLMLAAAGGAALHYRSQARSFERQWLAAMAQLEAQAADPRPAAPATLHVERVWRAPVPAAVAGPAAIPPPAAPPTADETTATNDDTGPDASAVSEAWLAELQRTNPQLYEQMKQRSRLPRQRSRPMPPQAQQAWDRAIVYFSNRNTSALSPQAMAEYQGLLSLLQETWALHQQAGGDMPMEDRRAVLSAAQENIARLGPLLERERNQEYHDLAVGMGLSEADAAAMVGYINQIASNTSTRTIFATGGNALGGRRGSSKP